MIGTTVGTGNIWRFPRIMATNAEEGGAWFLFGNFQQFSNSLYLTFS